MILKQIAPLKWLYHTILLLVATLCSTIVNAQDKNVEIDIGVDREPVWYQQPWAWVVGAAIFILLLVAVLRGTKKR